MCGINILVATCPDLSQRLQRMNNATHHRGPDACGQHINEQLGVALGHNRLAIIDLSSNAQQPMLNDEAQVAVVFNGEIYNYRELRSDLGEFQFVSSSDTEVLLNSYLKYGLPGFKHFNGMWACAILDTKRQKLILSRDRHGIKPLYYAFSHGQLIASSEIKGILASGLVDVAVDPHGLNEYFTFQNIISERTLFQDIQMLPAGHHLELDLRSGKLQTIKYWDLEFAPDAAYTEEEYARELESAFYASIKRSLISDVSLGATISGGMDSSAIVAVARQELERLDTYTGYFDTHNIVQSDRCVSEKDDARIIANQFATKHHERMIVSQDLINNLASIVYHLEDPKVGMCYTFYTMAQLVASEHKVNLSGTGGDELFAGYPWRYQLIEDKVTSAAFNQTYFTWWSRLVSAADKKLLFQDKILRQIDNQQPELEFKRLMSNAEGFSPLNKALYFDSKTFLHGMLLVEDKMGMAFNLETRFPFLDNQMVDLILKLPDSLKYKDGISKYLLKKAFRQILPEEILHKRKQGFTPPDMTWYRHELNGYLRSMLLGHKAMAHEYIRPQFIETVLQRHAQGHDERLLIWSLLFFEGWCRTFLAGIHRY